MTVPAHALARPRHPGFWLYLALLTITTPIILGALAADGRGAPPGALALAAALYTVWLVGAWWLLLRLDVYRRVRAGLFAAAFVWGALVATGLALTANNAVVRLVTELDPAVAARWGPVIAGPNTEEILKLLGIVLLVSVAAGAFRRPLDGFLTGAACGLGFQYVENILYAVHTGTDTGDAWAAGVVANFVLRGFLHGLWSHAAYTAIAGYGLAWCATRTDRPPAARAAVAAGLFATAWTLHALNNAPLPEAVTGDDHAGLTLLRTMTTGMITLTVAWLLYRGARRDERLRAALTAAADPEALPPEDVDRLASHRRRRRAARAAARSGGARARHREVALQRAQLGYLRELADNGPPGPGWSAAAAHRAYVMSLRPAAGAGAVWNAGPREGAEAGEPR